MSQVSNSVSEAIAAGNDVSDASWVPALRAAAVVVVEKLVQACQGEVTARQLDAYLRAASRAPRAESSAPPGHLVRDTVLY